MWASMNMTINVKQDMTVGVQMYHHFDLRRRVTTTVVDTCRRKKSILFAKKDLILGLQVQLQCKLGWLKKKKKRIGFPTMAWFILFSLFFSLVVECGTLFGVCVCMCVCVWRNGQASLFLSHSLWLCEILLWDNNTCYVPILLHFAGSIGRREEHTQYMRGMDGWLTH